MRVGGNLRTIGPHRFKKSSGKFQLLLLLLAGMSALWCAESALAPYSQRIETSCCNLGGSSCRRMRTKGREKQLSERRIRNRTTKRRLGCEQIQDTFHRDATRAHYLRHNMTEMNLKRARQAVFTHSLTGKSIVLIPAGSFSCCWRA